VTQDSGDSEFVGSDGPLNVPHGKPSDPAHQMFVDAGANAGHPFNSDFNGAEQEGVGIYHLTRTGQERCSASRAYLTPVLDRSNLTVLTGARLAQIALTDKVETGVSYLHEGVRVDAAARSEVVIAAGAVQSPQLLQLSGIGDPVHLADIGIPLEHALPGVGKNLQDHLDVLVQYHCNRLELTLDRHMKWHRMALLMARYMLFRSGPGAENPVQAGGFIKSRLDLEVPDLQLHFLPVFMLSHGRRPPSRIGYGRACVPVATRESWRNQIEITGADSGFRHPGGLSRRCDGPRGLGARRTTGPRDLCAAAPCRGRWPRA
jgi:choline dehydrogenase